MYVVDALWGSYKPSALAARIVEFARKHNGFEVHIEQSEGWAEFDPHLYNYAAAAGYPLQVQWVESDPTPAERAQRIRNLEPLLTARRVVLSEGVTASKALFDQFCNFGMVSEDGLPDVVARVCGMLPAFVFPEERTARRRAELDFQQAAERDHWQEVFGGPAFQPVEELVSGPDEDEYQYASSAPAGLDDIMPGLFG
jgi:hypothetical protein